MLDKRVFSQTSKRSSLAATMGPPAHGWREPKAQKAEIIERSLARKTATNSHVKVRKNWSTENRQK